MFYSESKVESSTCVSVLLFLPEQYPYFTHSGEHERQESGDHTRRQLFLKRLGLEWNINKRVDGGGMWMLTCSALILFKM